MARDNTLAVRKGILTMLKADAAVTAIVPAAQVYTQVATNPVWPFIRYGTPSVLPIRASCLDGMEMLVAVHGFAGPRWQNPVKKTGLLESAEDQASRLGSAIARVLDSQRFDLTNGYARIEWRGGQLLIDGAEADAFHTVQNLRIRCVTGG